MVVCAALMVLGMAPSEAFAVAGQVKPFPESPAQHRELLRLAHSPGLRGEADDSDPGDEGLVPTPA
jgi:hypothetical protein